MAGILGNFFGNSDPQGGILGGQPMPQWASTVGMIGAALKDAGSSLNGRDSNSVAQFQDYMRQNQLRQAYALAANGDPSQRQQAYGAILAAGGDPSALQKAAAQQALPQLMQNLQPSEGFNDNPVGVTPAVNATGPGVDAARATALQTNAGPSMSMQPATFSGALQRTGSPELTAEMAPQLIKSQMDIQAKSVHRLTPQQATAAGYPADAPVFSDQYGNLTSEAKPTAVINQTQQAAASAPLTPFQRQSLALEGQQRAETRRHDQAMEGGGGNIDVNDPTVQSYKKNIQNGAANLQNVPGPYRSAVSRALTADGPTQYTPTSMQKFALASSRVTKPYTEMSGYKLTADALPYLARIDAASKVPGSVSDQDILDSLTKLNTGGNAVTDAQIRIITDGKSLSDWAGVLKNKIGNGGVLSDSQRAQIKDIAGNIYDNYRKSYKPIYSEASQKLTEAGIPKQFWTIPDLDSIGSQQMTNLGLPGAGGKPAPAPGAPKPAPNPADLPRITAKVASDADYAKLPSGTVFTGPDGKQRRKP